MKKATKADEIKAVASIAVFIALVYAVIKALIDLFM